MASNATTEFRVRTYQPSDFSALYALLSRSGRLMTQSGLREHLESPMLQAVYVIDGEGLSGVRDVRVTGRGDEADPIFESSGALAESAPTAAFDALLEAALACAADVVRNRGASRGVLQTRCSVVDWKTQADLERNRLVRVRELWTIVRPTLEDIPEPRVASGIELRPYRMGDEAAWVEAFNEAFADHFGGWMGMPLPVWHRYVASPVFKPDISLVAWDGERIAGFGHFRIDDELNQLRKQQVGTMRYIGVRPAWRRLGLARALTRAGLLGLRRHGMQACVSGVDGTNVTGAHLLYLQEGFEVSDREYLYRMTLTNPPGGTHV
ncbi:MAG: GNAT family N-acetyltransferase, partial [Chloroflexi bacterium]|nr:GNAT family N-acetyltransferase [Chloroflexota bacterium]